MERKRYIPSDSREHREMTPPLSAEQIPQKIQSELGLPPIKIDRNRIFREEGELIAVRGIDPGTGKRILTLCGK